MKLAIFLGAGASVPFDKPITSEMKSLLYRKYDGSFQGGFLYSFLDCYHYNDIEHVLQSLRDLKDTWHGYGGKYFQTGTVDLFIRSKSNRQVAFQDFIKQVEEVEKVIIKEVFHAYSWINEFDEPLRIIWNTILSKLIESFEDIRIITTNYDRAIEEYCSWKDTKYQCIDGFKRDSYSDRNIWNNGDFESCVNRESDKKPLYIYKLHGSLNWKEHKKYGFLRTDEESIVSDPSYTNNLVIYPTISPKDGMEIEPFRTVRNEFEKFLLKADACFVIGFSFRDAHVNEIFRKFIHTKKPFVVLSPSSMENVCNSLLGVKVPTNYDKGKVSSIAPVDGNVWCIPHKLHQQEIQNDINLVITHLTKN